MTGYTEKEIDRWMTEAINEAKKAEAILEVPIGAVIVKDGQVIGRGHNHRETLQEAAAHAEMTAIKEANQHLGNWRLEECDLFVTLEPCVMCSGAIVLSRLRSVYYGPADPKGGAVESLMTVLQDDRLNHQCEVHKGVRQEECSALLSDFFRTLRARKKREKALRKSEASTEANE